MAPGAAEGGDDVSWDGKPSRRVTRLLEAVGENIRFLEACGHSPDEAHRIAHEHAQRTIDLAYRLNAERVESWTRGTS